MSFVEVLPLEYMTIICDLKGSRKLINREKTQYKIINMLKAANMIFANNIVVPFIITIGDEWEGLLKINSDYVRILQFFHKILNDIDFYCGIGIGPVSIRNFELTVNQLDGPSFYLAREAIKLAKKHNKSLVIKRA